MLGVVASLALTRILTGCLFGITATDPATFLAVGVLVTGIALLAGFLPALRVARVDAVTALRMD
jgi:putative ABC transport system permease protein